MPSVFHRVITALLLLAAMGAWGINHHHSIVNHPEVMAENKVWYLKHRGYPNQFGFLSHHWGLRVVESEIETAVKEGGDATIAVRMKLFDSEGLMGFVTLQFDAGIQVNGGNRLKLEVDKRTAAITEHSEGFDLATFQPYLDDLLHDMYQGQRNIISISNTEAIMEIPYMGIVRVHPTSEAKIINSSL
ncbi:hypothetical protein [Enterovibrio calviensis]|uniref:hypothetical protein n=1 Tax=Enterovibrio calviensis TaxID=91359 RepID=UPI00047F7D76|nr:hypothetical protein [Enterovibrio calviensis]